MWQVNLLFRRKAQGSPVMFFTCMCLYMVTKSITLEKGIARTCKVFHLCAFRYGLPDRFLAKDLAHCLQLQGFSPVCSYVGLQSRFYSKGFRTMLTLVRFLTCVQSNVVLQSSICTKSRGTMLTFVRFLTCVCLNVVLQVRTCSKGFWAIMAPV